VVGDDVAARARVEVEPEFVGFRRRVRVDVILVVIQSVHAVNANRARETQCLKHKLKKVRVAEPDVAAHCSKHERRWPNSEDEDNLEQRHANVAAHRNQDQHDQSEQNFEPRHALKKNKTQCLQANKHVENARKQEQQKLKLFWR
jgi:hypothetical protein